MEEGFRDRAAFIRGAKDIAKEVKKHAAKRVVKGLDRVQDEYSRRSYSRFEEEDDDDDFPAPADGYYRGEGAQDEEEGGASSDLWAPFLINLVASIMGQVSLVIVLSY